MDPRAHPTDVDLIRLLDGEAGGAAAAFAAHVGGCDTCRLRRDALAAAMTGTLDALRDADAAPGARAAARSTLRASLARDAGAARLWTTRARLFSSSVARWSTAAAAIAAVLLTARALRSRPAAPIDRDALPIAALTPGATSALTADQLCRGQAPEPAPADPATRAQILHDYGMAQVPERDYELDYLITPALGGANDRHNLWPERYSDREWNAKVKDQLEDLLPALVCAGTIDLHTAQRDIAADWIAAYKKYFKTAVPLKPKT